MGTILEMRSVAKLALAFLLATTGASAETLAVSGSVHFYDGEPIRGGTVILTQLHGFFLSKPRPLGARVTDASGKFEVTIDDPKGSIDIRLVEDRCSWTSAIALIDVKSVVKSGSTAVELVARRDRCESE